jgi:DNA-binding response OmpR family regulator
VKRHKLRQLIRDVLAESRIVEDPITFSTLVIDYNERTFTLRGNKVRVGPDASKVSIPLLSTERAIITDERLA